MIIHASGRVSLLALTLAITALAPAACVGEASDSPDEDVSSVSEAVTSTSNGPSGLMVIQNASQNGTTNKCLIMGNSGQDPNPSRYLWGGGDNGYCGFANKADLLSNKQAIWKFTPLGDNKFTIQNASQDGATNKCLIMDDNGQDVSPSRHLWGGGDNGYCGFANKADLLSNKQAVWTLTSLGDNKYTLQNASQDGATNKCLIMNNNGQDVSPSRHLWGGGDNGYCGFANKADLLSNKQAVWTISDVVMAPALPLPEKFAPRLRFDGDGHGYPMSAQTFYDAAIVNGQTARIENTSSSTLGSGLIPTYYQVIECGSQVRIKYWWFYGYQSACDVLGNGTHNGDWEDVTVTLSENKASIAAVTFSMHGHTYTRIAARGGLEVEESTHPVVYVAQNSHASFYEQGGAGTRDNATGCIPSEESRHNTSGLHLDSWSKLVSLDSLGEPWMVADRIGNFVWGPDGVSNHPSNNGPKCAMNAADWTSTVPTWLFSQCEFGDRDDGTTCHSTCRSGYSDSGYTCTNWSLSSLDTYGQHLYGYDYTLPTTDVGLLKLDPR